MRTKVISVIVVVSFYLFVFFGTIAWFPPLALGTPHWHEIVAYLTMLFGFILGWLLCVRESIKWILER